MSPCHLANNVTVEVIVPVNSLVKSQSVYQPATVFVQPAFVLAFGKLPYLTLTGVNPVEVPLLYW